MMLENSSDQLSLAASSDKTHTAGSDQVHKSDTPNKETEKKPSWRAQLRRYLKNEVKIDQRPIIVSDLQTRINTDLFKSRSPLVARLKPYTQPKPETDILVTETAIDKDSVVEDDKKILDALPK